MFGVKELLGTEPEPQRNFTLNFTYKRAPVSTITTMFYTGTRFRVKFKVKCPPLLPPPPLNCIPFNF